MIVKENMKKVFSLQAIIAAIVLSGALFFVLVENFRFYRATSTVMVIIKSANASTRQNVIFANIAQLPTNLSFYESLLKNNSDIVDFAKGKSADERKKLWNDKVKVKQSEEGSVLSISFDDADSQEAQKMNKKIVRNLFDSTSMYYNIKDDVDLRIVDGPIISPIVDYWYLLAIISLLFGFSLAFLFDNFLNSIEKYIFSKKLTNSPWQEAEMRKTSETEIKSENFRDNVAATNNETNFSKDAELEKLNKIIQEDIYPNFPEMPKKASAPDNLPIGESSYFMEEENEQPQPKEEPKEEQKIETQENETQQETQREPTQEEIKGRLNQLLKG